MPPQTFDDLVLAIHQDPDTNVQHLILIYVQSSLGQISGDKGKHVAHEVRTLATKIVEYASDLRFGQVVAIGGLRDWSHVIVVGGDQPNNTDNPLPQGGHGDVHLEDEYVWRELLRASQGKSSCFNRHGARAVLELPASERGTQQDAQMRQYLN